MLLEFKDHFLKRNLVVLRMYSSTILLRLAVSLLLHLWNNKF